MYHHRQDVVYILDHSMTLTFDRYVDGGGVLVELYSQFLFVIYLIFVQTL